MTTLWELSSDLLNLENLIERIQEDEDLTEEEKETKINELFENWLKSSEDWEEKALQVASYIIHQEAVANAQKEEAKRIMELSKASQRQADRLRGYLINQMALTGKTKIEGIDGKLSLRKLPLRVTITNPDLIPQEYLKIEKTPRLNEIKKALKANPEIDWAYLEDEDNYSLTIR